MENLLIDPQLNYRTVPRGVDTDYFIYTQSYPIHWDTSLPHLSRLQFPRSYACLIRTSPISSTVTLHLLLESDLYSSFMNFEIDLACYTFALTLKENTLYLSLTPIQI